MNDEAADNLGRKRFVYFIATADDSMVKIGSSISPVRRLSSLFPWSPVPLKILAAVPGGFANEMAFHIAFESHFSHGEWFRAHEEIFAAIREIVATGAIPSRFEPRPGQRKIAAKRYHRTPEQIERMRIAGREWYARKQAWKMRRGILPDVLSDNWFYAPVKHVELPRPNAIPSIPLSKLMGRKA